MQLWWKNIIIFIILFFSVFYLYNQPINDDVCSAIPLTFNANGCTNGTNVGATTILSDPIGRAWVGGNKSHTVWYKFVAPASGNVTVTTDHPDGTLTDPQLAVFSSSNGNCTGVLMEIGSSDDINKPDNLNAVVILTGLNPGLTYFVELDGYGNLSGTFCLDVHDGGHLLTNDNCSNAMNLWIGTTCNYVLECTYTNYPYPVTYATGETWETAPACWSQGTALNSVWFYFYALNNTTRIQIEVGGSGTDPHVAIYSGNCNSLALVACQEDKGGGGAERKGVDMIFATTIGQKYYIQYDSDVAGGCNNICLSSPNGLTTPSNDLCANATSITLNNAVTGNNFLATSDGGFSGGTVENTIWYSFTPSTTAVHTFSLYNQTSCSAKNNTSSTHSNFYVANLQLAVYNTNTCTPTSSNEMGCVTTADTNAIELSVNLNAATPYLIMVDGYGGACCSFSLMAEEGMALPISLISFTGKTTLEGNRLEWSTATEKNNAYFTLERSTDIFTFQEIARINGAGNSTIPMDYFYTDKLENTYNKHENYFYYRLKQTDIDGNEEYIGKIVVLTRFASPTFKVYPNPSDAISIQVDMSLFEGRNIILSMMDAFGKTVVSIHTKGEGQKLLKELMPVEHLKQGMYLLKVTENEYSYNEIIVLY